MQLCREEIPRFGWTENGIKAIGLPGRNGALGEAVTAGNQIWAAYTPTRVDPSRADICRLTRTSQRVRPDRKRRKP